MFDVCRLTVQQQELLCNSVARNAKQEANIVEEARALQYLPSAGPEHVEKLGLIAEALTKKFDKRGDACIVEVYSAQARLASRLQDNLQVQATSYLLLWDGKKLQIVGYFLLQESSTQAKFSNAQDSCQGDCAASMSWSPNFRSGHLTLNASFINFKNSLSIVMCIARLCKNRPFIKSFHPSLSLFRTGCSFFLDVTPISHKCKYSKQ